MKLYYIYGLLALFVLAGCDKSADEENFSPPLQYPEESGQAVPEDCFCCFFLERFAGNPCRGERE